MDKKTPLSKTIFQDEEGWAALNDLIREKRSSKVFVLVDSQTKKNCLPYFFRKTNFKNPPELLEMPPGETHKNLATCQRLWGDLIEKGADKNSLLINLGGGVVSDVGGFVAATFKRGIGFVHVPTSLLAMTDAAIGGKNGVNLGPLKNQIGVIEPPSFVLIDTAFLKTLPQAEIRSGTAEMFKHGLIRSESYWEKMKHFDTADVKGTKARITESIAIKSQIVAQDPNESGLRKTLNFGHTLGHAIESFCMNTPEKKGLLHGEAVAIGMVLAAYLSSERFGFPKEKLKDVADTLLSKFPKTTFSKNEVGTIESMLVHDKKNRNGKVLFVLLNDIGECNLDCEVPKNLIYNAFEFYKKY